jgi:hypothetical protein
MDNTGIEYGENLARTEQDSVAGFCKSNEECSGSITGMEYLDQLLTA